MHNMRRHFRDKHESEEPLVFQCPKCEKNYTGKNGFQTHIYRKHPEIKWKELNVDTFLLSNTTTQNC